MFNGESMVLVPYYIEYYIEYYSPPDEGLYIDDTNIHIHIPF